MVLVGINPTKYTQNYHVQIIGFTTISTENLQTFTYRSPGADPGEVKWVNFHPLILSPLLSFFFLSLKYWNNIWFLWNYYKNSPPISKSWICSCKFVCSQRTVCSKLEGLCILLKRLAFPCRYIDMVSRFERNPTELCLIFNTVLEFVYSSHYHRLESWNQPFFFLKSWSALHNHPQSRCSSPELLRLCWWDALKNSEASK